MVSDYLAVALGQKIDLRKKVSDFAFVKNFMAPFFRSFVRKVRRSFISQQYLPGFPKPGPGFLSILEDRETQKGLDYCSQK